MTKTIILTLGILFSAVFNYSSGMGPGAQLVRDEPITGLVINANVTVVLVGSEQAKLEVIGDQSLTNLVTLKKRGNTLVIGFARNKDLRESVIVYVPASQLRKIWINSDAHVRSLHSLQIPELDVVLNGSCKINIANIGAVNLIETDGYSFEQSTQVYRLPPTFSVQGRN